MVTFLLCGLWHGAAWTYVAFGAYQGLVLILHRMVKGAWERLPLWTRQMGTFGLWVLGLTIFRSSGFGMALTLLGRMFTWRAGAGIVGESVLLAMLVLAAAIAHWGPNTFELRHRWSASWVGAFVVLFGLCLFALYGFRPAPYIYFQF